MGETDLFNVLKLPLYKNPVYLHYEIDVLNRTQLCISIEFGVSKSTIGYWFGHRERQLEYIVENKNRILEYGKNYREENKDKLKIKNKLESEKESKKEHRKRYRFLHSENIKASMRSWTEKNSDYIKEKKKIYSNKNKSVIKKHRKIANLKLKVKALKLIGGCRCEICGDKNVYHLTVDHIDNTGYLDKKDKLFGSRLYRAIVNKKISDKHISNLRTLCWNHNDGRNREYFDKAYDEITYNQQYQIKLWKEAYSFFGPCKCGIKDLKFLTISHIHNNGAEERKEGKKGGINIILRFRKQGWPESLKEDFCIECFTCNCSSGNK
jgi:hypothetical protein